MGHWLSCSLDIKLYIYTNRSALKIQRTIWFWLDIKVIIKKKKQVKNAKIYLHKTNKFAKPVNVINSMFLELLLKKQ